MKAHENNRNRELLDSLVKPGAVGRSSVVSVNDELRGNTVNESVEDVRNVGETLVRGLRYEATDERKCDRRFRVQVESAGGSSRSDSRSTERVLEPDCRERDTDRCRVRERSLEGKVNSSSGVVVREIERLDRDKTLEAVHTGEHDLRD